jgi:hypothetical protein
MFAAQSTRSIGRGILTPPSGKLEWFDGCMAIVTFSTLWLICSTGLLLFLPGIALLRLLAPKIAIDQQIALAPALSTACIALLWLYATLVRVPIQAVAIWIVLGCAALLIIWRLPQRDSWAELVRQPAWYAALGLGLFALLGTGLRLYWWREAVTALGSDGYHHSLITQLMIDQGHLPDNYQPYAPMASFSYHFAFHTVAASLHLITGRDAVTLTRFLGQIYSLIGLLPIYALCRQLGAQRLTALLSLALIALLSAFPSFFINWSRLTQQTALAIIPAALALSINVFEEKRFDWRLLLLAGITVAGLFAAHYLIVVYFLYGFALLCLYDLIQRARQHKLDRSYLSWLLRPIVLGSLALLLAGPWIYRLIFRFVPQVAMGTIDGSADEGYYKVNELGMSWESYRFFLLAAVFAGLFLVWRKKRGAFWLLSWATLSIAYSNPTWLWPGLPAIGLLDFITVLASSYIPAGILIALGLEELWLIAKPLAWRPALFAIPGIALVLISFQLQASLYVPSERYVQVPDLAAAQWLAQTTDPDSLIMPNCFAWPWSPDYVVSADAGGWMPLLANRPAIIPPVMRNLEWVPDSSLSPRLAQLCTGLSNYPESDETRELLRENGIELIYLGERDGFIDPNRLAALPDRYKLIYQHDKVEIFEVLDP